MINMQSNIKYTSNFSQQVNQYQTFLQSLKLQSNFGCIITEKIAIILEHYNQISSQWDKKQNQLKTFYLYNTKLVQILYKFGEHEKKILSRLHSLQQLNTKIIKQYCFKNNKPFKLDQIYKPIQPIFSTYQITKWKFDIPINIQRQIEPYYHEKLFQIFNQYLLPKQDKLKGIIQQKLNVQKQSQNQKKDIVQSILDLKSKLEKYTHRRQLVNKDSMFDLYALKKEILQNAQTLQLLNSNDKSIEQFQQRQFVSQITIFHSKLEKIEIKQLIQVIRRQKDRQRGIKKSRNRQIAELELNIQKLMDENIDLKAQSQKLGKQIIQNQQQIHKLRTSLKQKQIQLQYKSMKKGLNRGNSINNNTGILNEQIGQQIKHLKLANLNLTQQISVLNKQKAKIKQQLKQNSLKFSKQIQNLNKQKERMKQQLKDTNLKIYKQIQDFNKQKSKMKQENQKLKDELKDLKNKYENLKLVKQRDGPIQAYLFPTPEPILISPIIQYQLPADQIVQLRKKLIQNQLVDSNQSLSDENLIRKCIQFIENQPKISEQIHNLHTQVIQKDKIIQQKQIQFKEVQRKIEVVKTEITKVQKQKQQLVQITSQAVNRMNKSQNLACKATNIILETALKGPQAVIKQIQANLQQIKNLLRVQDYLMIQNPSKFKNTFNDDQNIKLNAQSQNNDEKQHEDSGHRFSFNEKSLIKQVRVQQQDQSNLQKSIYWPQKDQQKRSNTYFDQNNIAGRDSYHFSKNNINSKYERVRNQQSPSAENKTEENASVNKFSHQQNMKATLSPKAKKQSYTSKKGSSFNNNYYQRKNSDLSSLSQSFHQFKDKQKNQEKYLKQNLNASDSYDKGQLKLNAKKNQRKVSFEIKKNIEEDRQSDYQVEKLPKKQQQNINKSLKIQAQKIKKLKDQSKSEQLQIQKQDLVDSSNLSIIPIRKQDKLKSKGNQSKDNIFKCSQQFSLLQQLNQQKYIQIANDQKNNINFDDPIQINAGQKKSKDDSNKHTYSLQSQQKSIKNIKIKNKTNISQQTPSSRYDKSSGQIQLKTQQEYEQLKRKYQQLLKKKLQLDQKLKSKSLESDQNQIKGFIQKTIQLEKALQKSQKINKQNYVKYQTFLRELQDSGVSASKQKMQDKIFFLQKRIRQLQKINKQQKNQFQTQVKNQIKKSEEIAQTILKQFRENQIIEQSRESFYKQQ